MYGNSIAQLESDVVWGIITANPAMADGTALFHANHKNLAGTGAALAVDAVGAARAAMALQTGLDKKTVLNIRPAFLIVPAALELILTRAAEEGAKRALADVGLDGDEAALDIRDLRSLVDCIRLVRRTAMQTAVRMITTGVMLALLAGIAIKLKIFGGSP